MGLVETNRGPTISPSFSTIWSNDSMKTTAGREKIVCVERRSYSELEMAPPGNQYMAAREHTGFITGEDSHCSGNILRIKMLLQWPSFTHALSVRFWHDHGRVSQGKSRCYHVDRDSQRPQFNGHSVGHRLQRRFGRCISAHARQRLLGQPGADDDDFAGLLSHHSRQTGLRTVMKGGKLMFDCLMKTLPR